MVFRRKRRGADGPRVDDLFYDNPTPDRDEPPTDAGPGEESAEAPEASLAGPEDGPADGPGQDVGAAVDPDVETDIDGDGPVADGEHRYAARADRDPTDGATAVAGRRRTGTATAGRWGRALAVAAVGATLVYGAGAGVVGDLDLARALDREGPVPGAGGTTGGGVAVVTEATLACPGPGLVGLDDPTVAEPDQGVVVRAGSAPEEALGEGLVPSGAGTLTLTGTPDGESDSVTARPDVATVNLDGALWARGVAEGSLAAGLTGSQLGYSFEEQQWGLSTAACGEARDDTWLVGGGGEAGRVERIILANPTGNPVTVSVEVLGADGPVAVVGGSGIVVAPGGRQVVLLDALAPGEERPVVHVTSTGGPVLAALGDRWLEGTLDRGSEVTTAAAAPATELVIPAVAAPRRDTADSAFVRVAVPGSETAVVELRALTPDGPVRLEQGVATVPGGSVVDVDVSDLPRGTHAIEVAADTPVVAAAHMEWRDDAEGVADLAWSPATIPSADLHGAHLATSGDGAIKGRLNITSLEGATVEVVTLVDGAVQTREVGVPAASSQTIAFPEGTEGAWVRTEEGTAASAVVFRLEHSLGTQLAGLSLPTVPLTREVRATQPWRP